jgi:hypothetical protein
MPDFHVGRMDKKKGGLVSTEEEGHQMAGQEERRVLEMRQMLRTVPGSGYGEEDLPNLQHPACHMQAFPLTPDDLKNIKCGFRFKK